MSGCPRPNWLAARAGLSRRSMGSSGAVTCNKSPSIPTAADPSKTRELSLFEGVVVGAAGFGLLGVPLCLTLGPVAVPVLEALGITGAIAAAASELQPTVRF